MISQIKLKNYWMWQWQTNRAVNEKASSYTKKARRIQTKTNAKVISTLLTITTENNNSDSNKSTHKRVLTLLTNLLDFSMCTGTPLHRWAHILYRDVCLSITSSMYVFTLSNFMIAFCILLNFDNDVQ